MISGRVPKAMRMRISILWNRRSAGGGEEIVGDIVSRFRPHDGRGGELGFAQIDFPGAERGDHVDVQRYWPPYRDAEPVEPAIDPVGGAQARDIAEHRR